jgi:hypothetical protein
VTSYDRIDWHLDSAIEAGQPEEHAFAHIGLYLAWLIRRNLHEPRTFPEELVAAVKAGEMTGSDLRDVIDGKLTEADMSAEGVAFSDARYEAYLDAYAARFAQLPEYGVEDGPATYEKVEPILDQMYAEWVAGGRQAPPPPAAPVAIDDFTPTSSMVMVPPGFGMGELEALLGRLPGDVQVVTSDSLGPRPHAAPDLEALIPSDLTSPPMEVESDSAKGWDSSLLTRALKRLGVPLEDAHVVHAIGGEGPATLTISIYSVPGVDPARLVEEFRSVIFRIPGSEWEPRTIAGREVQWAPADEFTVAFWARDGMVLHVTGQPDVVVPAVSRLP